MNTSSTSNKPPTMILVLLGTLAAIFLGVAVLMGLRVFANEGVPALIGGSGGSSTPIAPSADQPPGAVLVDVPWKHLHHIDSFSMTNQNGEEFDTAQFSGKRPFLVSFFFAGCPSICKDLNRQVERLNEQLKKEDVSFVSITVNPDDDTVEVLNRYAKDFGAESPRWSFLRAPQYKFKEVGEQMFRVEVVDMANHTDNIMLVDKWGRFRDRFKWDDPYDMKRLVNVVKEVASETRPPMDDIVRTRNAMVGMEPVDLGTLQWLREFHLTTSENEPFFSRDLVGEVWIANFFFSTCPTICKEQTKYLRGLQNRLEDSSAHLVSITTDPVTDTADVLKKYARDNGADPKKWTFLTGNERAIPRVAGEFFSAMGNEDHHSTDLFVVDKWGSVRGRFSWQDAGHEVQMLELVKTLNSESQPPARFDLIRGK